MGETPEERQTRLARQTSEAVNGLGPFLCNSVHRWLGAEELDRALEHVARDFLPFLLDEALFWRADLEARPDLARRIRAGLEGDRRAIGEIAERGLARASPAEAQGLRLAIRNVLLAMGVSLPAEAGGPCELHGPSCPEPGQG